MEHKDLEYVVLFLPLEVFWKTILSKMQNTLFSMYGQIGHKSVRRPVKILLVTWPTNSAEFESNNMYIFILKYVTLDHKTSYK